MVFQRRASRADRCTVRGALPLFLLIPHKPRVINVIRAFRITGVTEAPQSAKPRPSDCRYSSPGTGQLDSVRSNPCSRCTKGGYHKAGTPEEGT
jgi:hypothetical protein